MGTDRRVLLGSPVFKQKNDFGSHPQSGSNKNLSKGQREVAERKPIYLGQLFFHAFSD